jgi:hypothetical protein
MNGQSEFGPVPSLSTMRERPVVMGWVSDTLSGTAIGAHVRAIQVMAGEYGWRWVHTVHATSADIDSAVERIRRMIALIAPDGVIVPDLRTVGDTPELLTDMTSVVTVWPAPRIYPYLGGTVPILPSTQAGTLS